jgi:hypothetical protein
MAQPPFENLRNAIISGALLLALLLMLLAPALSAAPTG